MLCAALSRRASGGGGADASRRLASTRRRWSSPAAAPAGDGDLRARGTTRVAAGAPCRPAHHRVHRGAHRARPPASASSWTARVVRSSSSYASVDHSAAYKEQADSSHGAQLQLALEEGRGRDDQPFDPFSQFLDDMGTQVEGLDDYEEEGDEEGEEDLEGIEEAEYKEIDAHDGEEEDEDEEDDDDDDRPVYTNTGALYRPKSERLALRAGYPAGGNFAVIRLAGFQHKVTADDLLVVNKLKPVSLWSVGSAHTIKGEDVLLMADRDRTLVGLPSVEGGEVDVMVEEITRDKTLVIFKKRRRKHSRRKNGFRRQVAFLRVLDVRMPGESGGRREGEEAADDAAVAA
ncbi:hypothetical protein ACHAWF_015704 [Thalassiosira exigua]